MARVEILPPLLLALLLVISVSCIEYDWKNHDIRDMSNRINEVSTLSLVLVLVSSVCLQRNMKIAEGYIKLHYDFWDVSGDVMPSKPSLSLIADQAMTWSAEMSSSSTTLSARRTKTQMTKDCAKSS